jgi:chromosomal replication initiator protein
MFKTLKAKPTGKPLDLFVTDTIATVAAAFDLTSAEINSGTRREPVAIARQVAMWICRNHRDESFHSIGLQFGLTHGTVIHAMKSVQDRLDTDARFAAKTSLALKGMGLK